MKRVFLLDKSGSMESRISDTIGGFNTFVNEQKQFGGTLTLYTFSDRLNCVFRDVPIDDVKPLDNYAPSGNTALYDAMGEILNIHEDGTLAVLTDGEENASRRYTKAHVKDLIKRSRMNVIYFGADIEDAAELGIKNAHYYNGDRTPETFRMLSQEVSSPQAFLI